MTTIRFLSIDPSMSNLGLAWGFITPNSTIVIDGADVIETEPTKSKQIRASSDTIARCKDLRNGINLVLTNFRPAVIFAETPTGSQSAAGMKNYGISCMLLASLPIDPIEVTPTEVKLAVTTSKTTSKEMMISTVYAMHPGDFWPRNKQGHLSNKCEHIADAIAAAHAGIATPIFRQLLAMHQE